MSQLEPQHPPQAPAPPAWRPDVPPGTSQSVVLETARAINRRGPLFIPKMVLWGAAQMVLSMVLLPVALVTGAGRPHTWVWCVTAGTAGGSRPAIAITSAFRVQLRALSGEVLLDAEWKQLDLQITGTDIRLHDRTTAATWQLWASGPGEQQRLATTLERGPKRSFGPRHTKALEAVRPAPETRGHADHVERWEAWQYRYVEWPGNMDDDGPDDIGEDGTLVLWGTRLCFVPDPDQVHQTNDHGVWWQADVADLVVDHGPSDRLIGIHCPQGWWTSRVKVPGVTLRRTHDLGAVLHRLSRSRASGAAPPLRQRIDVDPMPLQPVAPDLGPNTWEAIVLFKRVIGSNSSHGVIGRIFVTWDRVWFVTHFDRYCWDFDLREVRVTELEPGSTSVQIAHPASDWARHVVVSRHAITDTSSALVANREEDFAQQAREFAAAVWNLQRRQLGR